MYLFYSLLIVLYAFGLLIVLQVRAWHAHKPVPGVGERLGILPESLRSDGRPTIWFHSCSVGETLSVQPLVHLMAKAFPQTRFVFSTTTETGQALARQRFASFGAGNFFYFPVDLGPIVSHVLRWIRPSMIVIVETEIWPNLARLASRSGIPIVLVNGRISPASFPKYRRIRPVLRNVFRNYRLLTMASEEEAQRFRELGAPEDRIVVTGNMKYDRELVEKAVSAIQTTDLQRTLGLNNGRDALIVAGSTHSGEEQILFEALKEIRGTPGLETTRLLVAPRHPERFDAVAKLARSCGFEVTRRSTGVGSQEQSPVLLLDTVGELAAAYRFASVVFVGGTLIRHGGQNIMEPAVYSKPVVIGPSMENFTPLLREFRLRHAIREISADEGDKAAQVHELSAAFIHLLQNPVERQALGTAAFSIFEGNQGAARKTAELISRLYPQAEGAKTEY
jgi:3-deoxy-D-manno-octulosonic-acid transferase